MDEEEYRKKLIKAAQKRAAQIADGSYINEPWAPSIHTQYMCKERRHVPD